MKVQIKITGHQNSNYALKGAISGANKEKQLPFGGFLMEFDTKKEAKKSLWEAFKYLRYTSGETSNFRYSKFGTLTYDASCATIEKIN